MNVFDTYNIGPLIGQGLSGKVYLGQHKNLGTIRAIKIIPKSKNSNLESLKKEAIVLKDLSHSFIPRIIDIEEDAKNLYLIEEYKEGETLTKRIKIGVLGEAQLIDFAIKLSNIISYLHNREQPIIHLDIQPSNLIFSKDHSIHIIDFDHSTIIQNGKASTDGYGTLGFAAPEAVKGESADIRMDIYSIGAVIYYAATGSYPNDDISLPKYLDKKLQRIIKICLSNDKRDRYSNADELISELNELNKNKTKPSLRIGIAGTKRGVGTTYIALGLTVYIKRNNMSSIYKECFKDGHIYAAMKYENIKSDEYGTYIYNGICIRPYYGDGVELAEHYMQIAIEDYGTDIENMLKENPDIYICVLPGSGYRLDIEDIRSADEICVIDDKAVIICNMWDSNSCHPRLRLSRHIDKKNLYCLPYISWKDKNAERLFKSILERQGTGE